MGVQNLLPFVSAACRPANVSEFRGKTVAVDTSCWLHRGVFGCVEKLANGQQTDFYVQYVRKYVRVLEWAGVSHIILVFDGQSLPSKSITDQLRKSKRTQLKNKAKMLKDEGKHKEALECLKQSTTITFQIMRDVIKYFRSWPNVDCLVSPYESDAQLTYLQQQNIAQLIISEDSDLIPFGCDKVLFKMDSSGSGQLFCSSNLHLCVNKSVNDFDFVKFRRICILSGCDYLPQGLPGIGLQKAKKFFNKTEQTDLRKILPRIPLYLNMSSLRVTEEFISSFILAENTFLHQLVFSPRHKHLLPLNPYPQSLSSADFPYAGQPLSERKSVGLALGNFHTKTHERVDNFTIEDLPSTSIFHGPNRCSAAESPAVPDPTPSSDPSPPPQPVPKSAFVSEPSRVISLPKAKRVPFKSPLLSNKWIENDLQRLYGGNQTQNNKQSHYFSSPKSKEAFKAPRREEEETREEQRMRNPFKKRKGEEEEGSSDTFDSVAADEDEDEKLTEESEPSPTICSKLHSPFKSPLLETVPKLPLSPNNSGTKVINPFKRKTPSPPEEEEESREEPDEEQGSSGAEESQPVLIDISEDTSENSAKPKPALSFLKPKCGVSGLKRKSSQSLDGSKTGPKRTMQDYFGKFAFKPPLKKTEEKKEESELNKFDTLFNRLL